MKPSLLWTLILAFGLASAALAANAKKKAVTLTPAEQATADRILAQDPQPVHNPYCPITGKPVDPKLPPVDCPQRFQHVHKLVGVASKQASDVIAAAALANKSNKWANHHALPAVLDNVKAGR